MTQSPHTNQDCLSDRFGLMLSGLPALLDVARAILLVSFQSGHKEAGDLRRRIEECAVDAHRLMLTNQIESREKTRG